MKSDYKAIPEMRDGDQIGVTFERRMTWREHVKIFLTGRVLWSKVTVCRLYPWPKKSKTLKWFPDKPGWNDKRKLAQEVRNIVEMLGARGRRNARRRLSRMEKKSGKPIKFKEEEDISDGWGV
jgi:hypothetical protein